MVITNKYDDIINLPYKKNPMHKMSAIDRASQFAPFSALSGFNEEIKESERMVDERIILDNDKKEELDYKLSYLKDNNKLVNITYFVKDKKKEGGYYKTIEDIISNINKIDGIITLTNHQKIEIKDIIDIEIKNK